MDSNESLSGIEASNAVLGIEFKEDIPSRLEAFQGVPAKYWISATDFNKLLTAIQTLMESGTGGSGVDLLAREAAASAQQTADESLARYLGTFTDLAALNTAFPNPANGLRADKADGRAWFRAYASSWQEVSTQLPRIRVVGAQTASATLPDAWHLGDVPWTNTTNVVLTLQSDALLMIAGHTSDHFSTGTGTVTIAYNTSLVSVLGHDGVTPLVIEKANLANAFVGVTIRYLGVQSGKLIYRVFGNLKTS